MGEDIDGGGVDPRSRHLVASPVQRITAHVSDRRPHVRRSRTGVTVDLRWPHVDVGLAGQVSAARPARHRPVETFAAGGGRGGAGDRRPTCSRTRRYAARRPWRRTSRSAPSPAPGRCSTRWPRPASACCCRCAARPRPGLGAVPGHGAAGAGRPRAAGAGRRAARRRRRRRGGRVLVPGLAVAAAARGSVAAAASTTGRSPGSRTAPSSARCSTPRRLARGARRAARPRRAGGGDPRRRHPCRESQLRRLLTAPCASGRVIEACPRGSSAAARRRERPRQGLAGGEQVGLVGVVRAWNACPETPVRLIQRELSRSASETTIRIEGAAVTS